MTDDDDRLRYDEHGRCIASPYRQGLKALGINPRALGTNPRALGTNPRAKARSKWALRNWKRRKAKASRA